MLRNGWSDSSEYALKYAKRIWRRIAISGEDTLETLHLVIFHAFDRFEDHLYSFYFTANPTSKSRSRLRGAPEYSDPRAGSGHPASAVQIGSLKLKPKSKFEYLFDYGDEWWHEITFEGKQSKQSDQRYPRILSLGGESPPQYPDPED